MPTLLVYAPHPPPNPPRQFGRKPVIGVIAISSALIAYKFEPGPVADNNLILFYTVFYMTVFLGMNAVYLAIIKVGGEQTRGLPLKRATTMPARRISVPLTQNLKPGFLLEKLRPRANSA